MMSPVRRLSDRHPFEIYLLAWAFVASLPAALGITDLPQSVDRQIPGWPGRVWVIGLSVGCFVALIGLAWRRPPWPRASVTGLLLEQVGLIIVGFSTLFYSIAVLLTVGLAGLVPGGIVVAFGFACFAQALKIERTLRASRTA